MGLFGFGKKKHHEDEAAEQKNAELDETAAEERTEAQSEEGINDVAGQQSPSESESEVQFPSEAVREYEGRGDVYGPWDVNDDEAPDFDQYLDFGAYCMPAVPGVEIKLRASRATGEVTSCTVTFGSSSLQIEAMAAPKSMGLWDDVRADLLESKGQASEEPGIFGMEVLLPVTLKGGKTLTTRIAGVDGPRWMLRGIFSGPAASSPDSDEAFTLNRLFSSVVVSRGEEPLAPRDLIPMHPPVINQDDSEGDETDENGNTIPARPDGPFDQDQQTEVQTTISRGPMFSEVR